MTDLAGPIQLRNGTAASATSNDPVLLAGEVGIETGTGRFKIGDGSTAWTSLSYIGVKIQHIFDITFENTFDDSSNAALAIPIELPAPTGTYTAAHMRAEVETAPTTASIVWGCQKNGSTEMFSPVSNGPTIATSTTSDESNFDVTTLVGGDTLTPYCNSIDAADQGNVGTGYVQLVIEEFIPVGISS